MKDIVQHVARFTYRDWRGGELNLLLGALIIAVASLAAVGFFVDRLRVALDQQATQLLGADLVIRSQRPIDPAYGQKAEALGLALSATTSFPSMVSSDAMPRLASVKAFEPGYPLRGQLRIFDSQGSKDGVATDLPGDGEVWVDPQLADALKASVGDLLTVGSERLKLTALIALEPDRGGGFVNVAPRALISAAVLARTGLIQPGSRVSYRLLVAGPPAAVEQFRQWLTPELKTGQRVETVADGRPELTATLDRAEQFLSLVALLSALIAAVAVALAARRFAQRHLDACAVVKSLGMTQRQLLSVLIGELALLAMVAGAVGALFGWGFHFVLAASIAPLLSIPLPPATAWPALYAMLAALVLLLGFGGWPFVSLAGVPPLRVLRRDMGQAPASAWIGAVVAIACFSGLMFWLANDRRLAAIALGGFLIGAVAFSLVAWFMLVLVSRARSLPIISNDPALRLALASWARRRGSAVAQTVALAIGLMALTLLTVTRTDLIEGWQRATPADAPNRFVINIQPDQRQAVGDALRADGITDVSIYPMVRGRLIEVNGEPVERRQSDSSAEPRDDNDRQAPRRELNLSYMSAIPAHNQLLSGRWLDPEALEVSVEEGVMKSLRLQLGDELTFDIAGEIVKVAVSNVRKVTWDSMKVNFFMILSPAALQAMPTTFITAFHQSQSSSLARELVGRFPNLTVFDTGLILRQVQSLLGQVVQAVQYLFLLTLAAGIAVLYGALATSRDERISEAGLMRALGASRRQLAVSQFWELALSGALAGLLAAAGALIIGAILAEQVFQFELATRWSMLPLGMLAGAVLAVVAGWMGLRPVLNSPPMQTLRAA
ncbi:MAG: FtsX-like permease family protein [Burkholderiaceae bacterium]